MNKLGMSQTRTIICTVALLASIAGCVYHHPPKAEATTASMPVPPKAP